MMKKIWLKFMFFPETAEVVLVTLTSLVSNIFLEVIINVEVLLFYQL